ncbi:hypothetical protein KJ632_03845, partial [Patescibacteria group bacterium]|nr:hypothetical protein [Patescibacteria group bacterium]
ILIDVDKESFEYRDLAREYLKIIVKEVEGSLMPFVSSLDYRGRLERFAEDALFEFENALDDPGFVFLLSEYGLEISSLPREDGSKYYYDLSTKSGDVISTFEVNKTTGMVNVVEAGSGSGENLLLMSGKKKL